MKNALLILICLLSTVEVVAQPILTVESQTPTLTETYTAEYTEVSGAFSPGSGGANQVWNFTNLPTPQLISTFSLAPPASGQNSQDYLGADFVWILEELGAQNYYAIEGDNIRLMGGVGLNFSNEVVSQVIYSQGETALQYPITFNTSYSYSSTFTTTIFGTIVTPGSRTGTVTADAYGTITTPFGTFEDVIRIVISSSEPDGFTETQYSWIQPGIFIPVMVYTSTSDPEVLDNVYYSRFDGVSSTRQPAYDYGLKIAGNPLRDQIQLVGALEQLPKLEFQVINQLGQPLEAQLETDQISLTDGPAGVYYLILIGEHGRQLLPFIRQ